MEISKELQYYLDCKKEDEEFFLARQKKDNEEHGFSLGFLMFYSSEKTDEASKLVDKREYHKYCLSILNDPNLLETLSNNK